VDDEALRVEVEVRVRRLADLAWSARENAQEPTEEEKTAMTDSVAPSLRDEFSNVDWSKALALTEEAKEAYVQSETEKLLSVARKRREVNGLDGPITDDEWHEICMDRHDLDMEAILAKLKTRPKTAIRDALIEMVELGKEDGRRSVTTDEELSALGQRMVERFGDLTERIKKGEFHGGADADPHEN
jgi:hypothetical protein